MDTTSLIGQNAIGAALQKQTAAQAANMSPADQKKVKKAAQDFEGFFVGQMMNSMTEGLETNDYFGGGHGEEMWRTMLNQEYGKEVAKSGRLGIANSVMTGMLRAQEERTKAQTAALAPAPAATGDAAAEIDTTPAAEINPTAAAVMAAPVLTRSLKGQ
ncbi:MAG: rod-binding protein [Rhodospirillaceae bacterium]